MSLLIRASLVFVQAVCNHLACTPPNKTPSKGRYHTQEAYVLQIAPLIFKIHTTLLWLSAAFEAVSVVNHYSGASLSPALSAHVDAAICPATRSQNVLTPIFVLGVILSALGMFIRVRCFQELGQLFTFDLTILPEHKLVTSGFYQYVRHPSYTGSLLLIMGLTLSHLTPGSWAMECGVLGPVSSGLIWASWWIWSLAVSTSRAVAEDAELRKLFGSQWDTYAAQVNSWFVPGLL
ncbi:hypothetical protein HYDPIDRAFT_140433 [Hydnomerulius pinastri MD-312]|uniref:Protein-S-isoprenylcysteine O-methyltransferase n=1 Tax=Hydnomerulius pinastri MD-312 TaxID=994086 RepID=A0A0C9W1A0_9AGAM|nr:hypothetical protein HYDPIDRAFT_140433 [Hydnomerulius pinastri MD-312]